MFEDRLDEVKRLCQEFGVKNLYVIGSYGTEGFDPANSDLDLLVEYDMGADLGPWLSRFHQLRGELEALFESPIDLVVAGGHRRASFELDVEMKKRLLYAA